MRTAAITGLLCMTMAAMLADLKTGKVPNGLIVAGVAMGVSYQVLSEGVAGVLVFAGGLLLPLLLMGGLFYFRMAGAGDIKLLCVTGGFLGPADGFRTLIASILIAGVISVWIMMRQRNFTGRMLYFVEYAQRRAAGAKWESYMAEVPESAKFSCFLKRTWVYRRDFLKKSIFAVCDLDSSYACNLMDYLNEKRSTPFEVQAFTNVESLKEFASEQEIEILLISTRAMCNEIRELPISRVVILSEGEQFQETDLEYPFVYKYQSSDQLISEVMEYYAGTNPSTCLLTTTVKTKLIGVYSPVGRSGKTSFALALGEILAETKQVLYLNLEEYSGFEDLFDLHYRTDITDLIYFARQKEGSLIYKLNSVIQSFHSLQYIPPALFSADLRDVSGEEWLAFLKEIMTYCEYDVIILDIGSQVDELFQLLQKCEKIYMPIAQDAAAKAKLAQYDRLLGMLDLRDLSEKTNRITLPAVRVRKEDGDVTQQLVWGDMGKFVRRLLWEEEQMDS